MLADGETRPKVTVTAQNDERLGLEEGREVLIPLKASWMEITQDGAIAQAADNQLQGAISHIERGVEQCEVLMTLLGGQTLHMTLLIEQTHILAENANVTAHFNADRAITVTLC